MYVEDVTIRVFRKLKKDVNSLKKKIPLLISLLVAISLVITSSFMYFTSRNTTLNLSEEELNTNGTRIGELINSDIASEQNKLKLISQNDILSQVLNYRNARQNDSFFADNPLLNQAAKSLINNLSAITGHQTIFMTDKNGIVISSSYNPILKQNLSDKSYMSAALKGVETISDIEISPIDKRPVIYFIEPVIDDNYNVLGTVGTSVTQDALPELSDFIDRHRRCNYAWYLYFRDDNKTCNQSYQHNERSVYG